MFDLQALRGEQVLVVGMARSGIAAAKMLCELGIIPVLSDSKTYENLQEALLPLKDLPCVCRLAEDPVALLDECAAVVISPGVPIQSLVVLRAKEKGIPLIGELELGARKAKGKVIAITGTNGKTTTTTLTGEIMKNAGYRTHVVGNIGEPITGVALDSKPQDVFVVEVSSFQLETTEIFSPDVAALLNITHDHLNRHGTFEIYQNVKRRIFERQHADQVAVLNADDPLVLDMAKGLRSRVHYFSLTEEVENGAYLLDGLICLARDGKKRSLMPADQVYIPGPHNLANAMASAAMAQAIGIEDAVIAETLRTFVGVEHRMELVAEVNGIRYINDSKGTNVDATQKAISAMKAPTVLILGGSDKQVSFAPLAQSIVQASCIREVVLIGETAHQIEEILRAEGFLLIHHGGSSMDAALEQATALAHSGWNILLSPACASFDMFRDFEHRGEVFKQWVLSHRDVLANDI